MKNEIISAIKDIANKQKIKIDLSEANLNKPFKDMGVDSIYVLGIIVGIEEAVGIKLDDAVLNQVKTINELIAAFEQEKNRHN